MSLPSCVQRVQGPMADSSIFRLFALVSGVQQRVRGQRENRTHSVFYRPMAGMFWYWTSRW